jgi:hypothetical protein
MVREAPIERETGEGRLQRDWCGDRRGQGMGNRYAIARFLTF